MFDENKLKEYRNTLPSENVKARILADLEAGINRKKTAKIPLTRILLPLAACLVLILTSLLFVGAHSSVTLSLPASQDPQIAVARSVSAPSVSVEADFRFPTSISVDSGKVTVTDAETGKILGEGTNLRVSGKVMIRWQLEDKAEKSGELTLSCLFFSEAYKPAKNGQGLIRTK